MMGTGGDCADQSWIGMEADAYRVIVGGDAKLMDRLYRLSPIIGRRDSSPAR